MYRWSENMIFKGFLFSLCHEFEIFTFLTLSLKSKVCVLISIQVHLSYHRILLFREFAFLLLDSHLTFEPCFGPLILIFFDNKGKNSIEIPRDNLRRSTHSCILQLHCLSVAIAQFKLGTEATILMNWVCGLWSCDSWSIQSLSKELSRSQFC